MPTIVRRATLLSSDGGYGLVGRVLVRWRERYTIARALGVVQWLRQSVDAVVVTGTAKQYRGRLGLAALPVAEVDEKQSGDQQPQQSQRQTDVEPKK